MQVGRNIGHIVGRDGEQRSLRALVTEAASGGGRIALLEGDAGIGKSTLLQDVAAVAATEGFTTFMGRAAELETRRPFAALMTCFTGAGGDGSTDGRIALARQLRTLGIGDGEPHDDAASREFRLCEATLSFVEERCASGPVALLLDDLHWADEATLRTLLQVVRLTRQLPLLVGIACRPAPRSATLDSLMRTLAGEGLVSMSLDPLSADAVPEAIEAWVGRCPGRTCWPAPVPPPVTRST